jgi:hypothetical protein
MYQHGEGSGHSTSRGGYSIYGIAKGSMEDSRVPNSFLTNPFPVDHPRYKDWETASRETQEEFSRFAADHLKTLPAESENGRAFDTWEIDAHVGRFDILAKAYCSLIVSDYRLADLYSKELLPDLLTQALSLVRPPQAQNAYFMSELKIRLKQRQFHWNGKALESARKGEHAKNCTTNGGADEVEILAVPVINGIQDQMVERPGATAESSADELAHTGAKEGPTVNATDIRAARRKSVDAYINEVFTQAGKVITRTDIWKAARYKSRTEFERWERDDHRATKAANHRFTRILIDKPHLK